MQVKIFNIPIGAEDEVVEEMNHFLRANKIIDIKKELALLDGNSCWTFCVTYMLLSRPAETGNGKAGGSGKVDYKEVLEPAAFERFCEFRKIRKQISDSEGVPAFAILTDAEMAEMSRPEVLTLAAMEKIPGIGRKKTEKYGKSFVRNETVNDHETGGIPDGADSQP